MAQTTALLGEGPSANALGTGVSAIAIFGLGRSACTHRRSISACRPGACSGVVMRAPIARKASRSESSSCAAARTATTRTIMITPAPAVSRTTTNPTYRPPSRNRVINIRACRPGSRPKLDCLVRIASRSRDPGWSAMGGGPHPSSRTTSTRSHGAPPFVRGVVTV